MLRVNGILETALTVADVPHSAEFYERLFGFCKVLDSERLVAFNIASRNVLLLFQAGATSEPLDTVGGVIPPHVGAGNSHLAFAIDAHAMQAWEEQLQSRGIAIESIVDWPGGARSLFFRDPDGHLIELATPGLWPGIVST